MQITESTVMTNQTRETSSEKVSRPSKPRDARSPRISSLGNSDIKRRTSRPLEFIIEKSINFTAFVSLAFIILIFVFVFREAAGIFQHHQTTASAVVEQSETYGEEALGHNPAESSSQDAVIQNNEHSSSISDLITTIWQPVSLNPKFGIWPLFLGSIKVALLSLLFGAPVAILAALYTTSFAPPALKEFMKPIVEVLAGFPSVVIGFFSLVVMASIVQHLFGLQYRLNALVGGIALSLAIIPVIFTISEDSMNAVPKSYYEASLALGAENWQTALFVILPAAIPGVFAAVLLGIGRAIGETMIVLMATGNAALSTLSPFDPVRTMSATIGAEMAEVVVGEFHYGVLFFIGVLLFAVSFILNLIVEVFVRRLVMRRFK